MKRPTRVTSTIQVFIATLILAATVIAYYLLIFMIVRSDSKSITRLSAEKELQLQLEQRYITDRSFLNTIAVEQTELDSYFLHNDSIVAFLEQVESLGNQTGTNVTVNSVSEDEKSANDSLFSRLSVSISSIGTWEGVLHTLSLLENMPKPLVIDEARVSVASGGEEQEWRANYEITVNVIK